MGCLSLLVPLAPAALDQRVAEIADGVVADGAVEVALEAVPHLQAPTALPEFGEDVVHEFFRNVARADVAVGELAEGRMVGPERSLERHGVARADLREPFAFVVNEREGHGEASIHPAMRVR